VFPEVVLFSRGLDSGRECMFYRVAMLAFSARIFLSTCCIILHASWSSGYARE